jgi:hypothetical protein
MDFFSILCESQDEEPCALIAQARFWEGDEFNWIMEQIL